MSTPEIKQTKEILKEIPEDMPIEEVDKKIREVVITTEKDHCIKAKTSKEQNQKGFYTIPLPSGGISTFVDPVEKYMIYRTNGACELIDKPEGKLIEGVRQSEGMVQ